MEQFNEVAFTFNGTIAYIHTSPELVGIIPFKTILRPEGGLFMHFSESLPNRLGESPAKVIQIQIRLSLKH